MTGISPTASSPEQDKADRLEEVLALIGAGTSPQEQALLTTFCRGYFRLADPEDVCERSAADLFGMLQSHLQFARQRAPGYPKLRVLNPAREDTGFSSRHTVVEVVNDDMPFLVDSTTVEINRQGLTAAPDRSPDLRRTARCRRASLQALRELAQRIRPDRPRESWMHVEVDRLVDPAARAELAAASSACW